MIDPFALNEAPLGEPLSIIIGQSSIWRREVNIDGTLFSLSYVLRKYVPDETPVDYVIPMSFEGSGVFAVDLDGAATLTWLDGRYFWDLQVTRISDDRTRIIETGEFRLFGNSTDRRSHAEVMIGKIEGVLLNRADNDVESYTIKSRSITKMSASELREWRDYYMRELRNQPVDTGMFKVATPKNNTLKVRFTN